MAASMSRPNSNQMLSAPRAAKVPAANRSESPGRKGVTTKPVSMKMTKNSRPYVHAPYWVMIPARYTSRCRNRSIRNFTVSILFSQIGMQAGIIISFQ
jgi:hypothetical protein